jgi:exonuclease VII large subunit
MSEIERISRSRLNDQRNRASKLILSIRADANEQLRTTKTRLTDHRNFVQRRSSEIATSRRQDMDQALASIRRDARRVTEEGRAKTEALFREIVAQRPEIPLSRGYAIAKSTTGKIVVKAAEAAECADLELVFFDGSIKVEVKK